jgi:non-specific serine/threonine protein kinase/protein-serine/threonine kinase
MLVVHPDARVACINVIKTARLGLDQSTDEEGNHLHVSRLVALRDWSQGINLPDERMTFSVLENTEPAAAILEHAQTISADHILMGARGHSATRRFLGSVSARVVSEATASVTVIRLPWQPEDDRSDQPPIQP